MLVQNKKIQNLFAKLWQIVKPRAKLGLVGFVLLAGVITTVWFLGAHVSFAAGVIDSLTDFSTKITLWVARLFISITIFMLRFIIELAGYNGYIDSTAVNIGWVMVRDVTNMFFVIVLLIISFGTILGLESYEYRKLLGKLIIAAIIVNFSRIICALIIDVAQVIMITFINGVAATAGGNLINMFNIDKIMSLNPSTTGEQINSQGVFLGAVAALTFSAIMMWTMAAYLFILLARMVMLWILIVLSPLAFVLNVLPQTQSFAKRWWSDFGSNVVSGPIIAFFLWLSFVTVGSGNIHQEIYDNSVLPGAQKISPGVNAGESLQSNGQTIGITDVMTWDKMANFAIAIGMLLAGAKMAQQLGVMGAGAMGKAADFGKKLAMAASGFSTARWAARGIGKGAKKAGKFALMNAPLVGGNAWQRRGTAIAGMAGVKWQKFQYARNEGAKKLEADSKELRKEGYLLNIARQQHKKGLISTEDLDKKEKAYEMKTALIDKGWAWGKSLLAGAVVQTQGRALKKAENWKDAAEEEKKIVEKEYSTSSFAGGFAKLDAKSELELVERKSHAKGKRKVDDVVARLEKDGRIGYENASAELVAAKKSGDNKKIAEAEKKAEESKKQLAFATITSEEQLHLSDMQKKEADTRLKEIFERTHEGEKIASKMNVAQEGVAAAEGFIKTLKSEDLKKQFTEAAEKMKDIIANATSGPDMATKLEAEAKENVYVRSLQSSVLGKKETEAVDYTKRLAAEKAQTGFWELPKLGRATPSTALEPLVKSMGTEFSSLEAGSASSLAVSWLSRLQRKKVETGELDPHEQATLFAATAHLVGNGWNDDMLKEYADRFNELGTKDEKDMSEEEKDTNQARKILVDKLGVIAPHKDENGNTKFAAISNPENSAALQQLVVMGGDANTVLAHRKISKVKDTLGMLKDGETLGEALPKEFGKSPFAKLTNKSKGYKEVAQKVLEADPELKNLGMTFDKFKKSLEDAEEFLQDGSSTFKRAALSQGHLQMGGHMGFDRDMGIHRMYTPEEAAEWMASEAAKRKGMESAQMHSWGTIDTSTGNVIGINSRYYNAVNSSVNNRNAAARVPERSRDQGTAYKTGQKARLDDTGHGVIGHSFEQLKKRFGDGNDAMKKFFKDFLLPALQGQADAFKLIAREKFDNTTSQEAESGIVKLAIELGDGLESIKANTFSDFIGQVQQRAKTCGALTDKDEDVVAALENAKSASKQKETEWLSRPRKNNKDNDDEAENDYSI